MNQETEAKKEIRIGVEGDKIDLNMTGIHPMEAMMVLQIAIGLVQQNIQNNSRIIRPDIRPKIHH